MIRLHIFNSYTYTHESLIAARELDLKVVGVPIRVNPGKQRPSRLVRSTFGCQLLDDPVQSSYAHI